MALQTSSHGLSPRHGLFSLGWVLLSAILAAETRASLVGQARRIPSVKNAKGGPVQVKLNHDSDSAYEDGCPWGKEVHDITEDLIDYSKEELEACLDDTLLVKQLDRVSRIPFSKEQLALLKEKLDKTYPRGYPENVIQKLGYLFKLFTPEDVSKWNITSKDTLKALLQASSNQQNAQVVTLITRYVSRGSEVDGDILALVVALSPIQLCLFKAKQLRQMQPQSFWTFQPRDLERCSPQQMEILCAKAFLAFQNTTGTNFLNRIQPYIRGANTKLLRLLIRRKIPIDLDTFKKLPVEAVLPLSASELETLLGPHVTDLSMERWSSPLREWIANHQDENLDRLGLGSNDGDEPNGYLNLNPDSGRKHG